MNIAIREGISRGQGTGHVILDRVRDVAEWYRSVPLADGVTQIYEPYIKPFYRCNIWHVRGRDRSILFDSGPGLVSLIGGFPWLTDLIAIASHTHFDHVGSHHEFSERACHVDSMGRLRELPVRVVHGGHYPSFGRDRYLELIDDYIRGRRPSRLPGRTTTEMRRCP